MQQTNKNDKSHKQDTTMHAYERGGTDFLPRTMLKPQPLHTVLLLSYPRGKRQNMYTRQNKYENLSRLIKEDRDKMTF